MTDTKKQINPVEHLMQLSTGYMASACIYAIARLRIADLLKNGPKPVSELAHEAQVNEDILYRSLRALASVNCFTEISPRKFANTPSSDFMRTDHPSSMLDMVLWVADAFHFDTYREMIPTLKDGKTALEHIHHRAPSDVIFSDPEEAAVFNNAMTSFSALLIPEVLEVYDFSGIEILADIAGGHGFVITSILQKYPEMKGILFELEHVAPGARKRVQELELSNRIQVVTGDFFKNIPQADAYIMKQIIHDWDDEQAGTILKNCSRLLTTGQKVILLEAVITPGNEPHFAKWLDVEMFMLPGGRERTRDEFVKVLEKAGLKLNRIIETKSPVCVLESIKI